MRGERVEVRHRIKGPGPLIKSARSLVLRLHRYGRGRARTPGEVRWAARAIDAVDAAVRVMEQPTMETAQPATPITSKREASAEVRSYLAPQM
jgi:hypothetical protein